MAVCHALGYSSRATLVKQLRAILFLQDAATKGGSPLFGG